MKKYQYVAEKIRKRIEDGTYPPKKLIPNQIELAKEFNVSKITVKNALDHLARAGMVYKKSGLGTYVRDVSALVSAHDAPANDFNGLYHDSGAQHVASKVIKFEVSFPDEHVAKNLGIAKNEPVYEIIRLRLLDQKPFILEHTFMPVRLVPDLTNEILHKSIYQYIHHKLHLQFGGAYRKIHAAKASDYDIQYLGAKKDTPMLEIEQVVWLTTGSNIEYSKSRNLYNSRGYTVVDLNES